MSIDEKGVKAIADTLRCIENEWFTHEKKAETLARAYEAAKQQPDERTEPLNSHADERLTKTGGMSFEVWSYILMLENKAHGNPTGYTAPIAWSEYYDEDFTPHEAIEEDFNYGG